MFVLQSHAHWSVYATACVVDVWQNNPVKCGSSSVSRSRWFSSSREVCLSFIHSCYPIFVLHYYYCYRSPRLATSLLFFVVDSVCLSRSFKLLLLFVSRWFRPPNAQSIHFWPSVLHMALYKTLFLDFGFRPPNAQNLLPKIWSKSTISWLVWQIDRRCFGLPGGFWGWPIQSNHVKCCGADSCCHGNEEFRLGADIKTPSGLLLLLSKNIFKVMLRQPAVARTLNKN